jgi:hypothetical protein
MNLRLIPQHFIAKKEIPDFVPLSKSGITIQYLKRSLSGQFGGERWERVVFCG